MIKSSNESVDEVGIKHHSLSKGGHILYVYSDVNQYIDNAVNFIAEALVYHHSVIFFETESRLRLIKERLKNKGVSEERLLDMKFIDAIEFYNYKNNFGIDQSIHRFTSLIQSYKDKNVPLRIWGNVYMSELETILTYEKECNNLLSNHQTISVFSHDGNKISGSTLSELLKVHDYFMTDEMIVPSLLYHKNPNSSPSIIEQIHREQSEENALIRSEQLAFAGQFAAGICHEIRNPLTTIKGFFQLIKEAKHNNNKYFEVIEDELSRIEQITSELLLLAKPHAEHRKKHNLTDIINSVKFLLDSQAVMKSIYIATNYQTKELTIVCEDSKIKQVLINIVKNAMEVMENGEIMIEAKVHLGQAIVSITDQGPGIPKEMLSKIGEPFFTTKEHGNGLGLLICFNIIKNHNGEIHVKSEEGKGTTFVLSLPLADKDYTEAG